MIGATMLWVTSMLLIALPLLLPLSVQLHFDRLKVHMPLGVMMGTSSLRCHIHQVVVTRKRNGYHLLPCSSSANTVKFLSMNTPSLITSTMAVILVI